jgi:hypothetical protein
MYFNSYIYIYNYEKNNQYADFVQVNNDYHVINNPTCKPTYNYQLYSELHTFDITQEPTEEFEQSNFPTFKPSKYILPTKQINNISCICEYNNNENKNLIIITCISSTLCLILFLTLIWYRFIFKKKLLKWQKNEANFGFGSV